jgi:hypothetical protein
MQPFRQFFRTRPVSKTLLLLGIVIGALGYGSDAEGLVVAGFALIIGAAIVAMTSPR